MKFRFYTSKINLSKKLSESRYLNWNVTKVPKILVKEYQCSSIVWKYEHFGGNIN